MTRAQAAQALAVLAAPFNHKLTDDEMEGWYGAALGGCPLEVGREVVRRLLKDDQFWPKPARFNEVRRAIERGEEPTHQLPPATPSKDERDQIARMIRETRAALKEMRKNLPRHWHGGPDPCPVCGGISAKAARRNVELVREAMERKGAA